MTDTSKAYSLLKRHHHELTRQQICTIKGQIKSGDVDGAIKGMSKILLKRENNNG